LWDSLKTVNNCDSVYKLTLTVNPSYYYEETATTCDNEPYVWAGHANVAIPTAAGTHIVWDSLKTAAGCDSVYKLTLMVNPAYYYENVGSTCANEPYVWAGHANVTIPTTAGTHIVWDSLRTTNGCDSVYKLTLTVHPTFFVEQTASTCDNVPYTWNGHDNVAIPTVAGTYVIWDSLKTVNNCDSVYKLTLTVNPTYYAEETVALCEYELPYLWHGESRTAAGEYYDRQQTLSGCDSVYKLTLVVFPRFYSEAAVTTCDNEPYVWEGHANVTIPTASGTYILWDSLKTVNNCDSVYKLTLTVNPSYYYEETATTCDNEPYVWAGHSNVTIPTTAGTHIVWDSLKTANYCDSVFKLTLTVTQSFVTNIRDTICLGDSYQMYGFDTLPQTYGTVYAQQQLQTVTGCDSVVNLILTVNRTYLFVTDDNTCANTPYTWRGHTYSTSGTYYDNFTTVNGCDSVYMLNLTVNPTYEVDVEDSIIVYHNYTGYGMDITPTEVGDQYYPIHYYTVDGCDSIINLTLHVLLNIGVEHYEQANISVYPNPTRNIVNIKGENLKRVYVYDGRGRLLRIEEADSDVFTSVQMGQYAAGYYVLRIQLADGQYVNRKIMVRP
ncbi:MAG: T9SS type A sorting domain-containing protein, partial [Bacteroidales bacterium]|nr:T9SS type A sorting domain-containing protein [Bacteroidales bacterium]